MAYKTNFKKKGIIKNKKPTNLEIFEYQDSHQEKVIHSSWNFGTEHRGMNYPYILEGTGDIFREFSLKSDNPQSSYINEKLRRIKSFLDDEESYRVVNVDTLEYAKENNPEKFKLMEEQWNKQPVNTQGQEMARQLNLAMIRGDYPRAKKLITDIENELKANNVPTVE